MAVTVALVGDTLLGRKVAGRILGSGPRSVFSAGVRDVLRHADLVVADLVASILPDPRRPADPGRPRLLGAPPEAVETLAWLGVTDVSLASSRALDFGAYGVIETRRLLAGVGIRAFGAGEDLERAWDPARVGVAGLRIALVGLTDRAGRDRARVRRAGVAYARLEDGVPTWLTNGLRALRHEADVVIVAPEWGSRLRSRPRAYVLEAGQELIAAGATAVAGHGSAVVQGIRGRVLCDLGGFLHDDLIDREQRNDLGMLWLLTIDRFGPIRLWAVPIALDYCSTRLAGPEEYDWLRERFMLACAELDTDVIDEGDRLVVHWT